VERNAAGIGLWDMDVVPNDPVNPDNTFHWSQEFRHLLGFRDANDFPDIRGQTSDAVRSIQEIDAAMQALASTEQAIDDLVQEQCTPV
jgi:hypothetical protein